MGFFSSLFKRSSEPQADSKSINSAENNSNLNADVTLYAPVTGTLLPLEEVPDIVISEKVMGEGVAVVPDSESVVAPCDGVISRLLPTKNAFSVRMDNGLEIYVSFGVESMELRGEGFTTKVSLGDQVKRGDPIIQTDSRLLASRIKSPITSMIVIKSSGHIAKVTNATGKCNSGISPVVWISFTN